VSGSFSVSAVNFRAGAKTPIASVLAAIFVLVAMQFMGPFMANLPRAALAGALIVTAYRMIDQHEIRRILLGGRGDAVIMVATFLGTLFLHLETAVFIGILLSFARYIMRTSSPSVYAVVPDDSYRHVVYDPTRPECPQLALIEILGDLYFGAVNHVEDFILDHAAQHPDQVYLLLRMNHVNNCDFSGIYMLENVVRYYRELGGDVYVVRVNDAVMQRMIDTGFDDYLGQDHFLDEDEAISYLFYRVLQPTVCIYECPIRVFKECQNLPKRLDLTDYDPGPGVRAENISWIDARTLWNKLHPQPGAEAPIIIDVREPREYRQGHIVEALSLPLSKIPETSPGVPKDRPIVIVCRTSRRSRLAAGALQKLGYENVTILDGGMLGWEAAGLLEAVEAFPTTGGSS
jgi:SulP family sulfate permease